MGNETQGNTMRAGPATTQEETIRTRADNHRDRKCRETDDTRDRDFKIRHNTRIMTIICTSNSVLSFP